MKLEIKEEDIGAIVRKPKVGMTPRDGLKTELYKELASSRGVLGELKMSYLEVMEVRRKEMNLRTGNCQTQL